MADNDGIAVRFQAYTGDGLPVSVTVGAQDFDTFNQYLRGLEAQYPQLGSFRMLLRDPPSGSLRPKEYRITGWMLGQTQDNKTGEMLPAVFLYSDLAHLEFSVATVYQEMLPQLPPNINWQTAQLVGNAAPPAAKARSMKSYNQCDMTIVMLPQFDHEGQPIMNKGGQPKYKFSHVIGYDAPPPTAEQGVPATRPDQSGPTGTSAPTSTSAPTGTTAAEYAGHRQPKRPVQSAGGAPGALRTNTGPGSCPQCRAPAGKPHSPTCIYGLATPNDTPEPENPFDDDADPLLRYAKAFSDDSIQLSQDTTALIVEMRQLDKTSTCSMTITVPADGDKPAVPGQYNFLVGLINKLAEKFATDDKEMHNKVLSFIFGSAVRSNTAPGNNANVLLERLHPGTQKRGPNPKFHQGTVDSINEIIGAVMFMDSLEDEEEMDYAA